MDDEIEAFGDVDGAGPLQILLQLRLRCVIEWEKVYLICRTNKLAIFREKVYGVYDAHY